MNRLNKENTKLPLTADMEIKVQQPFLLIKLKTNEIIGIWFFEPEECQRFGDLLIKLSMLCKDQTKLKIALMMETQRQTELKKKAKKHQSGIMGMFNKAQEEFNTKQKAASKSPNTKIKTNETARNQQIKKIHQPGTKTKNEQKRQPVSSVPQQNKTTSQEQQRLFQQHVFTQSHQKELDLLSILHGSLKKSPTLTTSANVSHRNRTVSTSASNNPELIVGGGSGGGGGFSIEQFASQAGDLAVSKPNNLPPAPKVFDCAELESELIRNKSSNDLDLASTKFSELAANIDMREIKSSPNLRQLNEVERENRHVPPGMLSLKRTPKGERVTFNHSHSVPTQGVTSMMSPNIVVGARTFAGKDQQKIALAANFGPSSSGLSGSGSRIAKKLFDDGSDEERTSTTSIISNSLMSPAAFSQLPSVSPFKTNEPQHQHQPSITNSSSALTKEQFQQAFVHMLQTNDDFVRTLHDAYLDQL